ncbi:hypothetical protein MYMA111404_03205 [Mycoplasma marinum]|uniref:DUF4231 domain-containing protein n=1 Tax=Mycoplasma marinum TaxID=1937190 RepID=A0A4R0XU71_9MOLU|nr:hypothetical protein [Mycoplasma marinum]TCG11219.1 hypothetical protein C4B24_02560 [Mycoplasma marinum]
MVETINVEDNDMNQKKGINFFVKRELVKLEKIKRNSRLAWSIITLLIALCNIAVVTIAVIALVGIAKKGGDNNAMLPASLVCLITIILFIMGFVLAFYQNMKQDHKYKSAIDTIQNEYMKFSNNIGVYDIRDKKEKAKILKVQIKKDLLEIFKVKKKQSRWKIFFSALIGDKDE